MTQGKMQVAEGPIETRIFQLLSAKHAIGLEAKGMRHSRL
jgi:phosphotransferase system IIA component